MGLKSTSSFFLFVRAHCAAAAMLFRVMPPCRKQWHSEQIENMQSVASSTICCIACSVTSGGQGRAAIARIVFTVQSTQ